MEISPSAATVQVGAGTQLSVTLRDSAGAVLTDRAVAWTSRSTTIADVNGSGLVTAKSAGATQVIASSDDKADTALITVVVAPPPPVASVTLAPDPTSIDSGATVQLAATLRDGNGTVLSGRAIAWSSLSATIATVNSSGLVTAKKPGAAGIVASSEGKADTAHVTVVAVAPPPVASVTLAPDPTTIDSGTTAQLTATLRDANANVLSGRAIAWSSLDAAIASVNGSGLVAGLRSGSARIVATSEGKVDTAHVTVRSVVSSGARVDTIFYEGFESGNLSLWQDGVDATHQAVRTNSTMPAAGGTHYLEMMLPASETDAWLTHFFMPGYDSVYVRMYVRFPSTWSGGTKLFALRGSPTNNQWGGFGNAGRCPNGTDFFSSSLTVGSQTNPGLAHFYLYYLGMPSSGGSCWGDDGSASNYYHESSGFSRGVWQKLEYWVKLNSPSAQDAVQRFWIDGVLWGEWGGISFRTTTNLKLNSLQLQLQNPGQSVYYDEILVTTAKPTP